MCHYYKTISTPVKIIKRNGKWSALLDFQKYALITTSNKNLYLE